MPAVVAPPEPGLLYVLTRPKPEYLEDYEEWYNTEHGPLRMQLDFMQNGYRYRAADGDASLYLAMYDLFRLSGLDEPQYTKLRSQRSTREQELLDKKLDLLDRRLYTHISSRGMSKAPAPVVMAVEMRVPDALEAEVHQWYEEEHTADLSRIPGWRSTRRYRLVKESDQQDGYTELLAVHDFGAVNGLDGPEHMHAKTRPWRNSIISRIASRNNTRFDFLHEFKASDYSPP